MFNYLHARTDANDFVVDLTRERKSCEFCRPYVYI